MYDILHSIMKDQSGSAVFAPYNLWHILYLVLLIGAITASILLLRSKTQAAQDYFLSHIISVAFALYMADFFLMPFSYGYIDIDKLPFHICTLSSILCYFARHNSIARKCSTPFVLLGMIGGLIYVVYPAGVADGTVGFFSYRILQTLLFHGLMVTYGVCSLAFGVLDLSWRGFYKNIVVVVGTVTWAVLGNTLYSGVDGGHTFNWCFVAADPFGAIPDAIDPYVMPFLVILLMLAMMSLIYGFSAILHHRSDGQEDARKTTA